MHKWFRKVHMYTGLLNFTILVIFGIVGLSATFLPRPAQRSQPEREVRYLDFTAPGGLDDRQLADHVYEELKLPLTKPAPEWAVQRDSDNNPTANFYTPGKMYYTTVLEKEARLRVETAPYDTWAFLMHLHEMTPRNANPDWRTQLWAYYVEFSIWSLIGMALSGVYLWLASRPGFRWAQLSFAAGCGILVLFFVLVR